MADFVAVIRRAVDGLANNTPEMRAKVYDKARGAVQRQLENMKPRPPEDMLRRQMEKLEAAIISVESEHAEALEPASEGVAAVAAPTAVPVPQDPFEDAPPVYAEPPKEEPRHVPEPAAPVVHEEPAEPAHGLTPAYREDDYEEPVPVVAQSEPVTYTEPVPAEPASSTPAYEEPQSSFETYSAPSPTPEEPAHQQYGDWRDDLPPEDEVPAEPPYQEPEPAEAHVSPEAPVLEEHGSAHVAERQEQPALYKEPAYQPVETAAAPEPEAEVSATWAEPVEAHPQPVAADPWLEPSQVEQDAPQPEEDFPYPADEDRRAQQSIETSAHAYIPPSEDAPAPAESAPAVDDWGWEAPAVPATAPAQNQQTDLSAAWDDVPELLPAGPSEPVHHGAHASAVEAHFDPELHVQAETVRMPPVSDLPELTAIAPVAAATVAAAAAPASTMGSTPAATAPVNDDPFADFFDPQPKPEATQPKAEAKPKADANDPWGDLEELIGFSQDQPQQGGAARGTLHSDVDADDLLTSPAKPYRVTPVRKRNYAGILLGIVGLLLVAGGGYAVWLNRDSLNDMVDGLIQSGPSATQTAQQTTTTPAAPSNPPAATRPATPPPASQPTPAPSAPNQQANANNINTNAAVPATPGAADGSVAANKFTQRLMADGSEMDAGPGGAGGLAQNAEGQSVAQLNAPPAQPAPATPTPPAGAAAPNAAPAATPAEAPALAGEKMFLYEERIGQTAPTAIEGAVSWSLQREPGANGRQEPVVQGRLNIPGRGLTALLTFKRNTDPSLPASHLIEIVFAVPPEFEGGAIESVQRIAMKTTEQDRGNALIAVPAKITDDFHMIALNDFPDARNTNLELLRSRNWIDIPLAYRNGRRALLTLQKGPEGERAFSEAIREWASLGPTASGQ